MTSKTLASFVVAAAVALGACGGSSAKPSAATDTSNTTNAGNTTATTGGGSSSGGPCLKNDPDLASLIVGVQIQVQLKDKSGYELLKSGTLKYDADAMTRILAKLEPLRDRKGVVGNGTVGDAIDQYKKANDLIIENLKVSDPFAPGGHGQELVDLVGPDITKWLLPQATIGQVVDDACTK